MRWRGELFSSVKEIDYKIKTIEDYLDYYSNRTKTFKKFVVELKKLRQDFKDINNFGEKPYANKLILKKTERGITYGK